MNSPKSGTTPSRPDPESPPPSPSDRSSPGLDRPPSQPLPDGPESPRPESEAGLPVGAGPGDADAEDDFPEYANDYNKELHRRVLRKKQEIRGVLERVEDLRERFGVMEEHRRNIQAEIRNAEALNAAKGAEIESEAHFERLLGRQAGKVGNEAREWTARVAALREKLNDAQQKVFENGQKMERTRLEINWNQEEMDTWLLAARQKEEDGLAIERYQRADESKIKELNLNIERLTAAKSRLEGDLAREVTETQALQIQLNKMAEEFQAESQDRHRLFEHWDGVIKHIAAKNAAQLEAGGKMAEVQRQSGAAAEAIGSKRKALAREQAEVAARQEDIARVERAVFQKKGRVKALRESERDAKANLKILQNRLSAFASELDRKKKLLLALHNDLALKQKRLSVVEGNYHKEQRLFLDGQATERQLETLAAEGEARLKRAEREFAEFLKAMSAKKHEFYQVQKELFRLKQAQSGLVAETAGLVTKIKNMAAHSNRLYADIQKQQELLYNAEYQIQLLERKVARAQGEKTLEETDYLNDKIRAAREEHAKVTHKLAATVAAMKGLGDEHRTLDKRLKALEEEQARFTVLIEKLNLENDMTSAELGAVVARKEEVLVQNNIMRLEVQKLQDRVVLGHGSILDLENRKAQLELSMKVREREVGLHQTVLQTELKLAEQERHKTAVELADRRNKVKNLQIKYQSLIQSKQGAVDVFEHSQAYYIINAAQEREELERRDDELKAQIGKSEFELQALLNTLDHLKGRNLRFREQQLAKNAAAGDLELKAGLQEQFHAVGAHLVQKKNEFEGLRAQVDSQAQFNKELAARLELLQKARADRQAAAAAARTDEQEQLDKVDRALKAVRRNQALLAKRQLALEANSYELCLFRQTVLEGYLKTLNSLTL